MTLYKDINANRTYFQATKLPQLEHRHNMNFEKNLSGSGRDVGRKTPTLSFMVGLLPQVDNICHIGVFLIVNYIRTCTAANDKLWQAGLPE
jgi:hypothetical protein